MIALDNLITEGQSLLKNLNEHETRYIIKGDLIARIQSLHLRGQFNLKKIDKIVYKEYSNLFSKTYTQEPWSAWNTYIKTELEKCLGFFMAINLLDEKDVIDRSISKVFISHGKFTQYFYKIDSFIKALGLLSVYDVNEPSQGKTINSHIQNLIENSDFYIIIATKETKRNKQNLPNHNVIIEYDRLIQAHSSNLIVLLEKGCAMPSMLQDVIYISMNSQNMDDVLIRIASELKKSGLIN